MLKSFTVEVWYVSKGLSGALVALLVISICSVAAAQPTSDRVSEASLTTTADFSAANISGRVYTANIETCRALVENDRALQFRWSLTSAYQDGELRYAVKVERPDATCDDTSPVQENEESDCYYHRTNERVGSLSEFTQEIDATDILGFTDPAECVDKEGAYDIILVLPIETLLDDDDESHEGDVVRINLDTVRPGAPGAVEATGGESSILVSWDEPSESDGYAVYYSTTPFAEGDEPEELDANRQTTAGTSLRITSGISVGQLYYVGVTTRDEAGNESLISPITTVETQPANDFWEEYLEQGGGEQGGYCQSASPGAPGYLLGVLFALSLLLLRRRDAHEVRA